MYAYNLLHLFGCSLLELSLDCCLTYALNSTHLSPDPIDEKIYFIYYSSAKQQVKQIQVIHV